MTLRRRVWISAACVVAVLFALAGWWLWPERATGARFTRSQYERIQLGMTAAEAEAAVGMATGAYGTPIPYGTSPWINDEQLAYLDWEPVTNSRNLIWIGSDGSVLMVVLSCPGPAETKVACKSWSGHTPEWELKAREWLGWLRGLVGL